MNPEKNEGVIGLKFFDWQPVWVPVSVLYSDYESVTVLHSCISLGFWKMEQMWLLSSKPLNPDSEGTDYAAAVAKGKEVLGSQIPNFKFEDMMRPTVQGIDKKCTYDSLF